jgi:hypothetical protein
VWVNITLSIDEKVVARARAAARKRGTSLNQMIRDYLEEVTAPARSNRDAEALERLWNEHEGDSKGWRFNRDELHDRSQLR